jgi:SAM-dependent methyltransferase
LPSRSASRRSTTFPRNPSSTWGPGPGALLYLKRFRPDLRVGGVEPVEQLRHVGHASGLAEAELVAGDATRLDFGDGAFDIVCAFGVLHHVRSPERVVGEMLRVARKGIFLSDSNKVGQGAWVVRVVKQMLNALGLWRVADFVKTRGKGYTLSEGDGLAYPYSVFNNYQQVRAVCRSVHVVNTAPAGINPYRTAGHVALLGVK